MPPDIERHCRECRCRFFDIIAAMVLSVNAYRLFPRLCSSPFSDIRRLK